MDLKWDRDSNEGRFAVFLVRGLKSQEGYLYRVESDEVTLYGLYLQEVLISVLSGLDENLTAHKPRIFRRVGSFRIDMKPEEADIVEHSPVEDIILI